MTAGTVAPGASDATSGPHAGATSSISSSRSIPLDACRGLAVLGTIFYHMGAFGIFPELPGTLVNWPAAGMFGVDLFYVLSGFFITQAVLRPRAFDSAAYLKARATRIYPAYLASLVIVVAIKIMLGHQPGVGMLTNVLIHVAMLHNFLPGVGDSLNGVYWTLGVEFPYYLLMIVLAPYLRMSTRSFWIATAVMIVICIVWRASVFQFGNPRGPALFHAATQLPGSLDAFAFGGVAALLYRNTGLHSRLVRWRWLILAAGIAGFVLSLRYFLRHLGDYWYEPRCVIIWRTGLVACFAIIIVAASKMRDTRALQATALPWLGKISFSLYLYQMLAINFVLRYFDSVDWGYKLAISSAIMLITSWISWRFIETRFHRSLAR